MDALPIIGNPSGVQGLSPAHNSAVSMPSSSSPPYASYVRPMSKNPFHATMIALQTPISNPLVFAKIMGRHRGLPLQRISNCGLRKRITKRRLTISHFRLSPFAFRNFSWCLPEIMGRHVERSNVYYTGHGKQREFNGDRRGRI